jgi:hypothetical protein
MAMFESYSQFRTQPPDVLRETLTGLIRDIRAVLVAEMQNDMKLVKVFAIVDSVAPPPPAAPSRQAG